MDGRYFIDDYVASHDERPTPELRRAIERMASAALARMSPFGHGLVFWYEPELAVRRAAGTRSYSGLTQAYYARSLANAARVTGDERFAVAADRCFASILVSADDGGVLYDRPEGLAIAQVPSEPRDFVLNGWLSSLVAIHEYAELRNRDDARRLVERSAAYAAALLPLYDIPELCTSRYALTDVVRLELRLAPPPAKAVIAGARIVIPGEGRFPLLLGDRGHWEPHLWPSYVEGDAYPVALRGSSARASVVISRVGFPAVQSFVVELGATDATMATLHAHLGRYDPSSATPANRRWVEIGRRAITPGRSEIRFHMPWERLDPLPAPTTFGKQIGGGLVNSYHPTHVRRLRQLAQLTGNAEMLHWARRWSKYMRDWAAMPLYRDRSVLLDGRIIKVSQLGSAG